MEEILKYTGLGGLALTIFLFTSRIIIKKSKLTSLTKVQNYQLYQMIIVFTFIITIISGLIYFFIQTNSSKKNNDLISVQGNNNATINGDNNTAVQGNNNTITNISASIPTYNNYTEEKNPDDLGDFLEKNMGKEVFLNLYFSNPKWDDSDESDTQDPNYTTCSYKITSLEYNSPTENSVFGNITKLEFRALVPTSLTYTDKITNTVKYYYYRQSDNEVDPIIVKINEKNEEFLTWEKWSLYLKGKYIVNRDIGGQGYNFIELIPIN